MKISILNGPNLDQLGKREESHYGRFTLKELYAFLEVSKKNRKTELSFFQTNDEGKMLEYIHTLGEENMYGLILNAGAWTHTSIALRDSLLCVDIPFVEVHISNIYCRDSFRHTSYLSNIAKGVVTGLGMYSYLAALEYFESLYYS